MKELVVNIVVALCVGEGGRENFFFFWVFLKIDDDENSCSF
jgi:hypothetical protein